MSATLGQVERVVRCLAETAVRNEAYFSELDAVVGDGDFGHSLARGCEQIVDKWSDLDRESIGSFLHGVALLIMRHVGGTSGPLWGTGFLRAGGVAGGRDVVEAEDVVSMLRAGVAGMMERGKADLGDKTLLDALVPAVDVVEASLGEGVGAGEILSRAAGVARERAETTRMLEARRGRAAYTGERSRGALDAGAVAVAVMLEDLAGTWSEEPGEDDLGMEH